MDKTNSYTAHTISNFENSLTDYSNNIDAHAFSYVYTHNELCIHLPYSRTGAYPTFNDNRYRTYFQINSIGFSQGTRHYQFSST